MRHILLHDRHRFIRDHRWKLYDDGRLFDLNADPEEESGLAAGAGTAAAPRRAMAQVQAGIFMGVMTLTFTRWYWGEKATGSAGHGKFEVRSLPVLPLRALLLPFLETRLPGVCNLLGGGTLVAL